MQIVRREYEDCEGIIIRKEIKSIQYEDKSGNYDRAED